MNNQVSDTSSGEPLVYYMFKLYQIFFEII